MKKPKHKQTHGMRIEPRADPMSLRPEKRMGDKPAGKVPSLDVTPKDNAYDRNFTRKGTPRLAAQSGEGSMGQRR